MNHGQYRFGPKARGLVAKIECLACREKKTVLTTVAEADQEEFLAFSRRQFSQRLGPCNETKDSQHDWKVDVLQTRSLAGNCMCEQCWPLPPANERESR